MSRDHTAAHQLGPQTETLSKKKERTKMGKTEAERKERELHRDRQKEGGQRERDGVGRGGEGSAIRPCRRAPSLAARISSLGRIVDTFPIPGSQSCLP